MKKRILIISSILLIIVVIIVGAILYNKKEKEEKEKIEKEKAELLEKRLSELGFYENASTIQVFLETNLSKIEVNEIKDEIVNLENIATVTIVTKEDALKSMREKLKENAEILDEYEGENNIFPDSIIVKVVNLDKIEDTIKMIEKIDGVERIQSSNKTLEKIKKEIKEEIDKEYE